MDKENQKLKNIHGRFYWLSNPLSHIQLKFHIPDGLQFLISGHPISLFKNETKTNENKYYTKKLNSLEDQYKMISNMRNLRNGHLYISHYMNQVNLGSYIHIFKNFG